MSRYDDLLDLVAEPTEDCIVWPYAKMTAGYGAVWYESRVQYCHRLSLATLSPPPTGAHYAAHGPCHNPSCVNPRHLSWKTNAENQADRLRDGTDQHGERNTRAVLTGGKVAQIRWLAEHTALPQRHLAACFGISNGHVSAIINQKTWRRHDLA
jgi:hypothetical protein